MDPVNILRLLTIIDSILSNGSIAVERALALLNRARAEGRDVTDAELDELRAERVSKLDDLRRQIGL